MEKNYYDTTYRTQLFLSNKGYCRSYCVTIVEIQFSSWTDRNSKKTNNNKNIYKPALSSMLTPKTFFWETAGLFWLFYSIQDIKHSVVSHTSSPTQRRGIVYIFVLHTGRNCDQVWVDILSCSICVICVIHFCKPLEHPL